MKFDLKMSNTLSSQRLENVITVYSYTRLTQLSTTFCFSKFPFLQNSESMMDYVSKMSFYLKIINLIGKYYRCLFFFIAPPLKIRFSVPVERVETTIFHPRFESRCLNPLHSYRKSDSQKSCYEK